MQQESMARQTVEIPLHIKDRLQITIKGTDEEVPTTYHSRVENMSDGDIVIRWPTSRSIRAPVHDNDVLSMSFTKGTEVYSIDSRILKRALYPIPQIVIRCEGPIRKTQRRDYVRVPAMVNIHLSARLVTANPNDDERTNAYVVTTRTIDISGGGFNIHHAAPLQLGSLYNVKLTIPTLEKPLVLMAKVVRMEPAVNRMKETYYDVGFAFIQIDESIRRQIIKYVFRFQQTTLAAE